jgi:hypothetical protein
MSGGAALFWARRLSGALAVLMVVQAGLGRALPGVYRGEAWIRATWIGNDRLTLLLAAPVLAAGLVLAAHGRSRSGLRSPWPPGSRRRHS